jgi:hypothetical protein
MGTPTLKIAAETYSIDTATDDQLVLDSNKTLPKIYAVKELTPVVPPGDITGAVEYEHGLTYAPQFLYYQQQRYFNDFSGYGIEFNPYRFIFGGYGRFTNMTSTKFYYDSAGLLDSYLILFLDPLADPASDPAPTTTNGPRLKIGDDITTEADFRNRIDSKYQTLKVHMKGQLVCNLPAFNATGLFGATPQKFDWFELEHGLGYPPIYSPFGINSVGLALDLAYNGSIPSDFVINDVNDTMAERWAYEFGWTSDYYEGVWLYVDVDNFYVGYRRLNSNVNPHTFPARTVRVNYVIFNNPINEEFDLLS